MSRGKCATGNDAIPRGVASTLGALLALFLVGLSAPLAFARQAPNLQERRPISHSMIVLSQPVAPASTQASPAVPLNPALGSDRSQALQALLKLPACERRTWDDKARHFLLSLAFTGSGYLILRRGARMRKSWALATSLGAVATMGIVKEFHDRDHGNPPCFSRLDLLANALGMGAAAGLIIAL